jgi:hypothetical protein
MELRQHVREPVHFSFQYSLKDDSGNPRPRDGRAVDLSEQGVRFEAAERLPVGTKLTLVFEKISSLEKELPLSRDAVVVWSVQTSPDESLYRVGLRYI